MSFQDVMRIFKYIYRTRLFDEKWTVVQQWNSINVGWIAGYLNTKFVFEVKKAGTVVIVLSQVREVLERIIEPQRIRRLTMIFCSWMNAISTDSKANTPSTCILFSRRRAKVSTSAGLVP